MTTRRKVSLADAPLGLLATNLRHLADQLRGPLPTRITEQVASLAAFDIKMNLAMIANVDGNAIGTVEITHMTGFTRVSNVGSQIAFLEFGTGAKGAAGGHPLPADADYMHSTRTMWVYWNQLKQGFSTSHGLPPQNQVLNAAKGARRNLRIFGRAELRRAVKAV